MLSLFRGLTLSALVLCGFVISATNGFAAEKGKPAAETATTADDMLKACVLAVQGSVLEEEGEGFQRTEEDLAVLAERRSLSDLISSDPGKNLAVQAPFIVMNAAQRVGVLFRSQGTETIRIPGIPHDIIVYNVASTGSAITKGQRVIGQEGSMEALVDNVDAQAMGDRASASVPLLIGSHGSGKSATNAVLKETFEHATKGLNSPHAVWTFEWLGLDKIPSVARLQPRVLETGGTLKAALDDSPILLLPADVRERVVDMARDAVLKMTKGEQEPMPFNRLNDQDQAIRNALLLHYRELAGRDLTSVEIVALLNKHTQLRRVVWDESSGALPIIDAQGEDVDIAGLLVTPNPVMRVTRGAADVFAWEPGKMLKGHGNVVFLDEVLRNPVELLRYFLRIFQDRKVGVGGSSDWPLDTVFIAATNTSSLNKVLEDPDLHALVDRFLLLEMPWPTNPSQIAQVLLHNYARSLKMQKLPGVESDSTELGALEPVNFQELYPRGAGPNETGPDYRYRLVIPMGDREIKFSPHALRLMSYIISATRQNNDMKKAQEVMPASKVPGSMIFRDPVTRIRFEEGKIPDVTNGEVEDLRKLAQLLDEGSEGIASRDGGRWISRVITEAKRPENRNTVTPDLVIKVYFEMLGKKIKTPDNKTRLKWQGLALQVSTQLIVPYIEQDVNLAMAADQASIRGAYFDMLDEMTAEYRDPQAVSYKSRLTNQDKSIDKERLKAVKAIFMRTQGKTLDAAQIAMYHESFRATNGSDAEVLHPGMMAAIASYYASLTGRLVSQTELAKFATSNEGDAEVRSQFSTVVKNMIKLGYDEHSAIAAIAFMGRIQGLTAQAPERR